MTKRLIFFSLLLCGCSTISYRKIEATSKREATMVIENQYNFLKETFTQSRESYYGGLRWSEECLSENKVGVIDETLDYVYFQSELFWGPNGETGVCDGEKKKLIFLHCTGDNFVREYRLPIDSKQILTGEALCNL